MIKNYIILFNLFIRFIFLDNSLILESCLAQNLIYLDFFFSQCPTMVFVFYTYLEIKKKNFEKYYGLLWFYSTDPKKTKLCIYKFMNIYLYLFINSECVWLFTKTISFESSKKERILYEKHKLSLFIFHHMNCI